jgi:BNR repeat-like domain
MKAISLMTVTIGLVLLNGCGDRKGTKLSLVIAKGQMPAITKDNSGKLHVAYGTGDSIMYVYSTDNGSSFSSPALINVLPQLAASHMRGPQIAASDKGLTVIACNEPGNIFSYTADDLGKWSAGAKVNDVDTVSKEGLMALHAEKQNAFAVWLDLRDKHNKIYGAKSTDAGKTWSANKMIYTSPDTTVCECCKPSVLVRGSHVYVMFRNWLNGNRDLYLVQSDDTGSTFGQAQKLGNGNWALDGCPMDGGALAINATGNLQTVWRRKDKIFSCVPGEAELELGEGKSCTLEIVDGKMVYAWVNAGELVCVLPGEKKILLGKGQLPALKAINERQLICIWEYDKEIYRSVVEIQ